MACKHLNLYPCTPEDRQVVNVHIYRCFSQKNAGCGTVHTDRFILTPLQVIDGLDIGKSNVLGPFDDIPDYNLQLRKDLRVVGQVDEESIDEIGCRIVRSTHKCAKF